MGNDFNVIIKCDTTRIFKSVIILDGEEVGKIGHNESVPFLLPKGKHRVVFRNLGSKTKPFDFEVGDEKIEILLKMVLKTTISLNKDGGSLNPNSEIRSVQVLGTRMGMETRILATYNYTIYSLLVIYVNGRREVIDCQSDSKIFKKLLPYLETKVKDTPLTTGEMIEFDEMED